MPIHEIDVGLESDETYTKELLWLWDFNPNTVEKKHCRYVVALNVFGEAYFSPITSYHAGFWLDTWEQLRDFIKETFGEVQIYRRWSTERAVYKGDKLVMAFRYCLCHEATGELIRKEIERCLENQNL